MRRVGLLTRHLAVQSAPLSRVARMSCEVPKPGDEGTTIFAKILRGEIPSKKVYEDDFVYAFDDINPQAPVHILIIPKRCISGVSAAQPGDEALLGKLIVAANKIAREAGISESGFRLVINDGKDGCQTVDHIHIHLIGGRQLTWPPG